MVQRSHRLGCESTIPSKSVLPRSGSPNLYSSCANLEMVLRSGGARRGYVSSVGAVLTQRRRTAAITKTYVCAFLNSADFSGGASVLVLRLPASGSVRSTGSRLWSFARTFCKSAYTALPRSVIPPHHTTPREYANNAFISKRKENAFVFLTSFLLDSSRIEASLRWTVFGSQCRAASLNTLSRDSSLP